MQKKKYGFKTLDLFNRIIYKLNASKEDDLVDVSQIDHFSEEIDLFWEKIKNSYDFIIVRDREYLNQRYCDPRGGNYTLFIAKKNHVISGYCVTRVKKYNPAYPEGYIADIITLKNDRSTQIKLFNAAMNHFNEQDVNCIHFWATKDSQAMKISSYFGFINAPNEYHMWFSSDNKYKTDFLANSSAEKLHFTIGDTDMV